MGRLDGKVAVITGGASDGRGARPIASCARARASSSATASREG